MYIPTYRFFFTVTRVQRSVIYIFSILSYLTKDVMSKQLYFFQACINNNLEVVEFLVSRGANINLGDNEGWTPLHAAASCGLINVAR